MNLVLVVVILFEEYKLNYCEKLNCDFKNNFITSTFSGYHCSVTSLDISNNEVIIDGFIGDHLRNKNNNDVEAILIKSTNSKYIPANLGFLIHHLTAFFMFKTELMEIKKIKLIN